jgi:hypothetical protein
MWRAPDMGRARIGKINHAYDITQRERAAESALVV